ncbi:MAG: AAA family ATPase [Bacteroidales bacterium]|nr:AAA family ATPase [Bacteroidales bacterium]
MNVEVLKEKYYSIFGFDPTSDQASAVDNLFNFIFSKNENFPEIFVLLGYAGTGKTSLMSAFVKTLSDFKINCVLLAPTGRAAKVFSQFSGKKAFTIHKMIYRQKTSALDSTFTLDRNLKSNTIYIVDEASMISLGGGDAFFGSGRLLDDLITYVFSGDNCRLILVGDSGQLPPVGEMVSPALDINELECYGKTVESSVLNEVVRQASESGILNNATRLRKIVDNSFPGDNVIPNFLINGFKDVVRISGSELLEELESSYDREGIFDTLVITRSNKNAGIYNAGIRSRIFWREEQISIGDIIMVVKNNYFYAKNFENTDFIANGDIAEVTRVGKYEKLYGFTFVNVDLRFPDYDNLEFSAKIILECLNSQGPGLSSEDSERLYQSVCEDYFGKSKKEMYKLIKENEYFNALQVKFAYAVTCHKSQGGQWANVFIDQGYITDEMLDREYLRWLYTAFTRATNKVFLVNFKDEFFDN